LARGYDGTAPRAWVAGDLVDLRLERKGIQEELTDLVAADAPARLFGLKASTSSGLNFGYYGGQMWVDGVLTTIADGLIALTASVTNYIEHDRAGVVSKNSVGFSADRFPIAEVVANTILMTSVTDRRISNRPSIGYLSKSVAGGAGTTILTAVEARNDIYLFSGALTGNRIIEMPSIPKRCIVGNGTTGAFTLTIKNAAGAGVTIPQGMTLPVFTDGVNWSRVVTTLDGMLGGTLATALNLVVGGTAVPTIVKRKTANEFVASSTTLQNDDHLTFAIGANEEWVATIEAVWVDDVAGGLVLGVSTPAGATNEFSGIITGSGRDGRITAGQGISSGVGFVGDTTVEADGIARVTIWVLNGATPGNVTLQWAQAVSNGNQTGLLKGSFLVAHKIA